MARIRGSSLPIQDGPDQRSRTGDAPLQDIKDGLINAPNNRICRDASRTGPTPLANGLQRFGDCIDTRDRGRLYAPFLKGLQSAQSHEVVGAEHGADIKPACESAQGGSGTAPIEIRMDGQDAFRRKNTAKGPQRAAATPVGLPGPAKAGDQDRPALSR